jgi:hypothetical protein
MEEFGSDSIQNLTFILNSNVFNPVSRSQTRTSPALMNKGLCKRKTYFYLHQQLQLEQRFDYRHSLLLLLDDLVVLFLK